MQEPSPLATQGGDDVSPTQVLSEVVVADSDEELVLAACAFDAVQQNQCYGREPSPSTPPECMPQAYEWFSPGEDYDLVPRSPGIEDYDLARMLDEPDIVPEPSSRCPQPMPGGDDVSPTQVEANLPSSSAAPQPSSKTAPSEMLPPKLQRCSRKRPSSAAEVMEQENRKKYMEAMSDVIDGPFMEGLMASGGKIPSEVYNALRLAFTKDWRAIHDKELKDAGCKTIALEARRAFAKECTWPKKALYLKQFIKEDSEKPERAWFVRSCKGVLDAITAKHLQGPSEKDSKEVKAHIVLFVYNHASFIIDQFKQDPKNLVSHEDLVTLVREHGPYQRLKEAFFKHSFKMAETYHAEMACSLEISPETYKDSGVVRVHLSLALGHKGTRLYFWKPFRPLAFGHVLPTYAPKCGPEAEVHAMKRVGFHKWWGQAAYYLQFPKVLMLDITGTQLPFKDYPVTQTCIMGYLQVRPFNDC